MSNSFWAKAISTAYYLQNRLGTVALETTPYELWTNQKPSISHLRIFGCPAYVHVPDEKH
jgi:hypothetical protein